jgi:hypothetical protein
MDSFDTKIILKEVYIDNPEIPGDFQLGILRYIISKPFARNHIRDRLIKLSNRLYDRFGGVSTPIEYDREVLKKIESILRVYDFLRHDSSWSFLISKTQFNLATILREVGQQRRECHGIKDLIESFFVLAIKKIMDEAQYALDNNTPLFLCNKDVVLEKFHSILKDRMENNLTSQDVAHIARSVISKDRRVVYQEIYIQINTELEKIAPEVPIITSY